MATTETAVVSAVETAAKSDVSAVKTDVTKVESSIVTDFKADVAKVKADLAALEAKTFGFKTLALCVAVAYVAGFLAPFLLKHL